MANVTMPTPVALAGGALCLLGGYLIGVVAGPDTTARTTAQVVSYERGTSELCLEGEAVAQVQGASDGRVCGTWRRVQGAPAPAEGDTFRFVTITSDEAGGEESVVFIYGDVVR